MPRAIPKQSRSEFHMERLRQWLHFTYPGQWEEEFRFHPIRKWRFDFACPSRMIALEIDGLRRDGRGAHQNFQGVTRDCEKANTAQSMGWVVFRATYPMLWGGAIYATIEPAMKD